MIGTPPKDERVDLLSELFDGLITDEGMANLPNLLSALDKPGNKLVDKESINQMKEVGVGWDQSVPIGSTVKIQALQSRTDLNGELGVVISHNYDTLRIAVRVQSTNEDVSIKPVNVELCE